MILLYTRPHFLVALLLINQILPFVSRLQKCVIVLVLVSTRLYV